MPVTSENVVMTTTAALVGQSSNKVAWWRLPTCKTE